MRLVFVSQTSDYGRPLLDNSGHEFWLRTAYPLMTFWRPFGILNLLSIPQFPSVSVDHVHVPKLALAGGGRVAHQAAMATLSTKSSCAPVRAA